MLDSDVMTLFEFRKFIEEEVGYKGEKHLAPKDVLSFLSDMQKIVLNHMEILNTRYNEGNPKGVRADFSHTNLKGVNFGERDFSGANFYNTTLNFANLSLSTLDRADLRDSKMLYTTTMHASFKDAKVDGMDSQGQRICCVPKLEKIQENINSHVNI